MALRIERTDRADQMRYRTAVKTGRTAAMQTQQEEPVLAHGAFSRYVAMVDTLSAGYVRPLRVRVPVPRKLS